MKINFLIIVLIYFPLIISGCSDTPIKTYSSGSLTGKVLDESTNLPIADVLVTTSPGSGTSLTDNEGLFSIENIEIGNFTVYAFKEGLALSKTNIAIYEDESTDISILLEDDDTPRGSLSGVIYDSNGGTVSFVSSATHLPF